MPFTLSNNTQLLNRNRFSEDSSLETLNPKIKTRLNSFLRDFQQPLTVISATTQLAQFRDLDEETQEDFSNLAESVERLHNMILQMRELINSSSTSNQPF